MKFKAERSLVLFAGIYGIFLSAPGFRPKELKDFFLAIFTSRGLALAIYGVLGLLLIPTMTELRERGVARTWLGAAFACVGMLFTVDTVFALWLAPGLGAWPLRVSFLALAAVGFKNWSVPKFKFGFWKELSPAMRVFAGLVFFFFWREQMHLVVSRSSAPFGDEIYFWHTAAVRLIKDGYFAMVSGHNYTTAVPWLTALPARILGAHNADWVFAYPVFIMFCFAFLLWELSKNAFAFVAGVSVLFFCFRLSRDLHHLYGMSLYGEAIATLMLAIILAEIYRFKKSGWPYWLGTAVFTAFCAMTKPPVASLSLIALLAVVGVLAYRKQFVSAVLLGLAFVPQHVWKHTLRVVGRTEEYTVNADTLKNLTINLGPPKMILGGLLNQGAPQHAYTLALILAFVAVWFQGDRRLLRIFGGVVFIYWGFVVGLYGTIWQNVEAGSAGRYLSHAALACLLLLPLAFSKKDAV